MTRGGERISEGCLARTVDAVDGDADASIRMQCDNGVGGALQERAMRLAHVGSRPISTVHGVVFAVWLWPAVGARLRLAGRSLKDRSRCNWNGPFGGSADGIKGGLYRRLVAGHHRHAEAPHEQRSGFYSPEVGAGDKRASSRMSQARNVWCRCERPTLLRKLATLFQECIGPSGGLEGRLPPLQN